MSFTEDDIEKAWNMAQAATHAVKNVVVGCVIHDGMMPPTMLCVQRRADQDFPLKWSIPGGKVEPGESLYTAAMREFEEEFDIQPAFELYPFKVRQFGRWRLHYLRATNFAGAVQNRDNVPEMRWVSATAAKTMDFLPDDLAVLRRVLYVCNAHEEHKTLTDAQGKVVPMHIYCQRTGRHSGQHRYRVTGQEPIYW